MATSGVEFTGDDYEAIRAGCRISASVMVPRLYYAMTPEPETVVDVGCGEGWFAREFHHLGASVLGVDYARPEGCAIEDFVEWDLSRDRAEREEGWFDADLAVCLETAEHLPPERGPGLVADLVAIAPTVAFSAAVPGQRGLGHLNERWQSYWAGLFADHGYGPLLDVRDVLWNDDRVEPWYRQNIVVYVQGQGAAPLAMLDVVHPKIFGWRLDDIDYLRAELERERAAEEAP